MKGLILEDYGIESSAEYCTLTGVVNGKPLYFRVNPDRKITPLAEPFICAMLLPAMQAGATIRIPHELTASSRFIGNLDKLQDIYRLWYPGLSKVGIECQPRHHAGPVGTTCATFFSGGVDATHTLLKRAAELTDLIYVRGIDMQLTDDSLWKDCLDRNTRIATSFTKTLVPIESNVRFFVRELTSPAIGWAQAQGCGLASLAHVLGYDKVMISSSNTYQHLHPYGSHPLSDPLFSSDKTEICHVGCEAPRHQKLIDISRNRELLANIRVCWQDNGFNCGICDKCVHLRMALRLLQLEAGGLGPLDDFSLLKHAHVGTLGEYIEWEDNLFLAEQTGDRQAIRALKKLLNRYKRKQLLKLMDEIFLDGRLLRLKSARKALTPADHQPAQAARG